jgi:hypothetical protein
MCLEEEPEAMYRRLKDKLRQSLIHAADEMAEDDALLFSEGVPDIPTVEELRWLERKAAFSGRLTDRGRGLWSLAPYQREERDVNTSAEKPAFRAEIVRLMADRGIESLEELRERFIAAGYGAIDRRDRTTSLWRFELHANGATGGLHQRFVWGLGDTLGLTEEETKELLRAYHSELFSQASSQA